MLDLKDRIALAEIDEILKYTDTELVNRIPKSMREFIVQNKEKEYQTCISLACPICDQDLQKETEVILSLIFRSYWATDEEKRELEEKDALELRKLKESMQVTFPVFYKQEKEDEPCLALQVQKPWYSKIFFKMQKILEVLHIKK